MGVGYKRMRFDYVDSWFGSDDECNGMEALDLKQRFVKKITCHAPLMCAVSHLANSCLKILFTDERYKIITFPSEVREILESLFFIRNTWNENILLDVSSIKSKVENFEENKKLQFASDWKIKKEGPYQLTARQHKVISSALPPDRLNMYKNLSYLFDREIRGQNLQKVNNQNWHMCSPDHKVLSQFPYRDETWMNVRFFSGYRDAEEIFTRNELLLNYFITSDDSYKVHNKKISCQRRALEDTIDFMIRNFMIRNTFKRSPHQNPQLEAMIYKGEYFIFFSIIPSKLNSNENYLL